MSEYVLPRARTRRRRPPSDRVLFISLWMIFSLIMLAYEVIRMAQGRWYYAFGVIVYAVLYIFYRQHLALWRRFEDRGATPPVTRLEWFLSISVWMFSLTLWIPLI